MGRIVRNYLYNFAYQLLVLIAPIITAPYLARVLGASNLGIYSYVNSSGTIITTISLLGIYAYGNRQTAYVRDNRSDLTKTFWELQISRLVLGTVGTVMYILYAVINKRYSVYFILYYPYILSQFLDCSWVYVGLEDMKPAVLKNFATKLINIVGIFLLVRTKDDVGKYIFLLAITTLVSNISIYTQLPKYIGAPKADVRNSFRHIKESVYLFLPQVAALFYLQVDKVMLEWITGNPMQVSFYDQAEKIISIPLSLIAVMSTVMMPRIANEFKKGNAQNVNDLLVKAGRVAILLALPMMCGLFLIAKQFIPWYLGDEFYDTAIAMRILAPIVIFNSLAGISGAQYFTATNQINILFKSYVSAAVINVLINSLLIPKLGYTGAAVATVASSLLSVTVQYYYLNQQIRVLPILRCIPKYFAGAAFMGGILLLFTREMPPIARTSVLQIISGGLIYLLYLLFTRDEMLCEAIALIRGKMKRIEKHN